MKKILILIVVSLFSFSLNASTKDIDQSKSEFAWKAKKVTGEHYGKVPLKSGSLDFDKTGKLKGGEVILNVEDFTVEDLSGKWAKKFIKHMKSGDFFKTSKWPTAKLKLTKVDKKNLYGDLTIKDKTNPVVIPYSKKGGAYKGTLTFDRTKFGMVYKSSNFFKNLGDKAIYDDVTVDFKVVTKK